MCRFPRRSAASGLLVLATVFAAAAAVAQERQTPSGTAAFDVASVKRFDPAPGQRPSDSISIMPGGRVTAPGAALRELVRTAYGMLDVQLVDSGRLLSNQRYEIEARTRPDVTAADARAMLRALLAERFGLRAHQETRELAVYALTVARADRRLGDGLRPSGPECAPIKGPPNVPAPPPPPPPAPGAAVGRGLPLLGGGSARCISVRMSSTSGDHWSYREVTMPTLVERFVAMLGRPVIDRTRLDGAFDIDLTYSSDNPVVDASGAPNAPSFVTAVREQLGLRLDADRTPVEVLVIDAIAPPTEN